MQLGGVRWKSRLPAADAHAENQIRRDGQDGHKSLSGGRNLTLIAPPYLVSPAPY